MIDLHYWTTPNGHKVTIFLEETGLPYKIIPVNIGKGEQFKREFLAISPNNRIPAMVDHAPAGGGAPIAVFESGRDAALSRREDRAVPVPQDMRGRTDAIQWLFWQMGNLGPMSGQNNHFSNYAVDKLPYAMDRYRNEVNRLYGVLEPAARRPRLHRRRLLDRRHGELSVDRAVRAPGPEARRTSRTSSAGSRRSRRGRRWCAPTRRRRRSIRIWAASAPPRSAPSCSARPRRRWSVPLPPRGERGERR